MTYLSAGGGTGRGAIIERGEGECVRYLRERTRKREREDGHVRMPCGDRVRGQGVGRGVTRGVL
jgi:hypothetical protein